MTMDVLLVPPSMDVHVPLRIGRPVLPGALELLALPTTRNRQLVQVDGDDDDALSSLAPRRHDEPRLHRAPRGRGAPLLPEEETARQPHRKPLGQATTRVM